MTRRFRPANGTEGEVFMEHYCFECERDKDQDCAILANTFCYDIDDERYPAEWIMDDDNNDARCTAFILLGDPVPITRCTRTVDMFDGTVGNEVLL